MIALIGATVNQPSQYPHVDKPPTWVATVEPHGLKVSKA